MNLHLYTTLFAAAALAPIVSQAPSGSQRQLADEQGSDDPASNPELKDAARWRERLSTESLEQREREYDALIEEARKDPRGRNTLEAWSKDQRNPEFAWTCRLALRELERSRSLWPGGLAQGNPTWRFDPDTGTGEWQLFQGWPQNPWGSGRSNSGGPGDPFPGWPESTAPGGASASSKSESFSLQISPDGVKCTVDRDVDGKRETQEYEAKTVEDLLREHPELERHLGRGGRGFSLQFGPNAFAPGFNQLLPGQGGGQIPRSWSFRSGAEDGVPLRTDVLGVLVHSVTQADAVHSQLEDGVGLYVDSVARNTLAERLGIEPGQTLVELDGRTLRTSDDVRSALAARTPGAELKLTLIDRFGERHTRTWRPDNQHRDPVDSSGSKDKPASKLRNL